MINSKSIRVPGMVVVVILAAIYSLGFIITPYWIRSKTTPEMVFILALTIAIGGIWIVSAAKELDIQVKPMQWGYFLILLGGVILLNIKPLTVDIPWRGDEDIHIARTMALATTPANMVAVVFGFAFL